jgi:uncharacterized protein YecE (DUF72 family)
VTKVLIGTSGWSYDDWHGSFYPKTLAANDRLSFYAERFAVVEVNDTHYRMPETDRIMQLTDRMHQAGLEAAVYKAPRSITHQALPDGTATRARQRTRAFLEALEPAASADLLDGVLFQFSHRAGPSIVHEGLDHVLDLEPPGPVFVETRHNAFQDPDRVQALQDRLAPHGSVVAADSPSATLTQPPSGRQAYFRFHGRNEETWFEEDPGGTHGSARYDHDYSQAQLEALADRVRRVDADRIRVFFNNHPGGHAARNASELMDLLGVDPPRDRVTLDDF